MTAEIEGFMEYLEHMKKASRNTMVAYRRDLLQLMDYLDYYHLEKGYMLSFNFNKKKEIGVKKIVLGNKVLVEAVV